MGVTGEDTKSCRAKELRRDTASVAAVRITRSSRSGELLPVVLQVKETEALIRDKPI